MSKGRRQFYAKERQRRRRGGAHASALQRRRAKHDIPRHEAKTGVTTVVMSRASGGSN